MWSAPSKNRTKKCKSKVNKSKLWDAFDVEYNTRERTNSLELLYSKQDIHKRDFCELCKSSLSYSEDNYLTCTNKKCGII